MKKNCSIGIIAVILVIIGALNWGLVGLFDVNLVTLIFGKIPILVKIIYILVGIAGLITIFMTLKHHKCCSSDNNNT